MPEKATVMKKEMIYAKVCGLLSSGKIYRKANANFNDICADAGVKRVGMDNLLYERFGMSGSDMLMAFRRGGL